MVWDFQLSMPGWIFRISPTVRVIPGVAEAVENGLTGLTWWAYVQRLAGGQLCPWCDEMQLYVAFVGVPHP